MGILKKITDEYFGGITRDEDYINVSDLDVEVVQFTDKNGKYHGHGYRVKDFKSGAKKLRILIKLTKRIIEKRGTTCSLNDIDVSNITAMSYLSVSHEYVALFKNSYFDGDISGWDVSNVKDMSFMFRYSSFSGKNGMFRLEKGNKVENMRYMFESAKEFNVDISDWDVSNVSNMGFMFLDSGFEFDLSKWEVRKDCVLKNIFSPDAPNLPDWVGGKYPDYFRKK